MPLTLSSSTLEGDTSRFPVLLSMTIPIRGKLVSDTWMEDREKVVFIDRSGDIFAFVLEYLRYGR